MYANISKNSQTSEELPSSAGNIFKLSLVNKQRNKKLCRTFGDGHKKR